MSDSESDFEEDSGSEQETRQSANSRSSRTVRNKVKYRDDSEDESDEDEPARERQKRVGVKVDTNRAKVQKVSYKDESSEDEVNYGAKKKSKSDYNDIMAKMKNNRGAVNKSTSRESSEEESEGEEVEEVKDSNNGVEKSNYKELMSKMKNNKKVAIKRYSSKDTSEDDDDEDEEAKNIASKIVSNTKAFSAKAYSEKIKNDVKNKSDEDEEESENQSDDSVEQEKRNERISNDKEEQSSDFDSEDYEKEVEEKPKKRSKKEDSDSDFQPDADELQRVNKRVRKQMRYNTSDLFDSEAESDDDEDWEYWHKSRKRKGPARERKLRGPVYSDDSDDLTKSDVRSNEVTSERDLPPQKQIEFEAWSEFINFSQHTVAAMGTAKKKKTAILWEIEFTDSWNPYTAGKKEVSMYLTLHKDQLKINKKDLDLRIDVLGKYLPDVNIKEDGFKCSKNQKFPYALIVLMDKGDLKYQDEWSQFVRFCVHTPEVDPFLAEPKHIRDFILGLFLDRKAVSSILKPFPHFYQENITRLCKIFEFYLKSAYDGKPLAAYDEIRDIYSIAECLDERLDGPVGECRPGSLALLERLTPPHWYWHYKTMDHKKDFWQHGLIRRILYDVQNKILTENDAACQLGVTTDMVACAVQRSKPENDEDLSLTVKQYLELEFGKEEDFWNEDSTQNMMDDVRNRVITVDNAAFQLGVTSAKVMENVGEIKTEAEVEAEKAVAKEKQQKAKQTSSKPKLSPLELQIKMAEGKNEDDLSAYEKMRLNNMRQKLEMFRMMGMDEERKAYQDSMPTTKRVVKNNYIAPREKSSRLKKIADQKEIERENEDFYEDSKVERQSPAWVGRFTPHTAVKSTSSHTQMLSDEEMRTLLHVPKLTIATNELIANNLDYHKGERFMQRLYAEVEDLGEEENLKEDGRWEGMRLIGGGKVSNQELVSLDMRGDIVGFGDRVGGVGFWLGEKSLVYRPHNLAVCRTLFVGSGEDTQLVSASHDGTVRVLDFAKQEFELMYSWHKQSSVKQGVVWIEPVDRNNWLVNCEGGDVLQLDRRDPVVKPLLQLKEAMRSSYTDYSNRLGTASAAKVVTPALSGSNISVHPVNKTLFSICDKETVDIYDIRNIKACVSSMHHLNLPAMGKGNAQFGAMNYHAGSGWSNSGTHFMTCPRIKGLQGSISTQSAFDLDSGEVTEWPGDRHQSVTGVNMLLCQGAVWCPWEENIFFASVNKKVSTVMGSNYGLVGVDVESGETVMDLNLSSAANLLGVHPSRPQIVVGNSSGPGVIEIFYSTEN